MKPIIKLWVGLFLVVTFCCSLAFAESKVVDSEGKYVMGDLDTKKDARALALMEAKRSALEQAGTYLESSSEVKNYELTKDEINSLTSGVVSVEILKEDWKMSGENLMVTVLIRATVDTSNLEERISALKGDKESVEELKDIQTQLAALQQELHQLKAERTEAVSEEQRETPKEEHKKKYVAIVNKMSALDYLKSANADLANGRLEQALSGFNEALSVNPEMAEAYAGQAVALNRMGRLHEALKKIDSALKIAPDSARAHAVKSLILAKSNRYARALKSINKAIELKPRNPRFYSGRGAIYLKLKRLGLAFKDFERACKMGDRRACDRTKALARRLKTRQRERPRSSR
jgi:regulator of sirC expression with transglutaminase-like and TPR domain